MNCAQSDKSIIDRHKWNKWKRCKDYINPKKVFSILNKHTLVHSSLKINNFIDFIKNSLRFARRAPLYRRQRVVSAATVAVGF